MKRQKKKTPKAAKANPAQPNPTPDAGPEDPGRRSFLDFARGWGVITIGAGAVGWYLVDDMVATAREFDLSKIGNGVPAVVQVHDPNCPICRSLQKEVRAAMDDFADDELQYLVANIKHEDGRALARAHDVPHVTLLLFDGGGERRLILRGENKADYLHDAFRRHVERYGPKAAAQ